MEIIVFVKQVPDTESLIQIAEDGVSIKTQDLKWIMNPYDEIAVEEALRIKEKMGGTITIVSFGTPKAAETIRTALAMGADQGILVSDPAAAGSDCLTTARILCAAIKNTPFDLIIAGQRAVDDDGYQVGAAVAELLGICHASQVVEQTIADGRIVCRRTVDGGFETLAIPLPALFTTQRGLNQPRYASLPGIMKAKKKPLQTKTLAEIGIDPGSVGIGGRKVSVRKLRFPSQRQAVRMIEGESPQEQAARLVKVLREEVHLI